jgi:hypothetical protein
MPSNQNEHHAIKKLYSKNILPCIRQAKCTYFLTDCAMERTAAEMKNKLESGGQKKKTTKRTKHNHN